MGQLLEKNVALSSKEKSQRLLNLGCGQNFHSNWVNLDIAPCSPEVQKYDLRRRWNFPDGYFDACYSSHVLEHLKPDDSAKFLQESFRVLKPGGVIRVVVPDLEEITRLYLRELERAEQGIEGAEDNYEWVILELLDQMVRFGKDGQMSQYLHQFEQIKNKSFVMSRLGDEFNYFKSPEPRSFLTRLLNTSPSRIIQKTRCAIASATVALIAGRDAQVAFKEGLFRNSGEVHRWMYDRFSLKRLLESNGFEDVQVCSAIESRIPDFYRYDLDCYQGKLRKPDSLFVEAMKPSLT